VAIGQKKSSTLAVIETLKKYGAMEYTTVVVSSADDPPAMRYLAPFAGCTISEYLVHELGRDVLIVYDDLTKHAESYRELSLLLRRPPGREAYPGDIFYLHARLLERAGKMHKDHGGGSLTALPIVELQRGNISAYIPTNLISITDGQIVLDSDLFNRGIKPAVNVGQSVSRVGGKAQTRIMRTISSDIRLVLAQYDEVSRFARFGTDVDSATLKQIRRGQTLQAALTQNVNKPLSLAEQIIILFAVTRGFFDNTPAEMQMVLEDFFTTQEGDHL
jgi:F-type H+-transporting ATPase subunit alpha